MVYGRATPAGNTPFILCSNESLNHKSRLPNNLIASSKATPA
jgi:hypothetical protein